MSTLGCTGHQVIPPEAMQFVRDGVASVVREHTGDALVGVCSLAIGADQLFAETVLRSGGELVVVVPCEGYESTFDDEDASRYRELLESASSVERLAFDEPSEAAFLAAGQQVAEACDVLVAVWDGVPAQGLGGTADVVSHAIELGRAIEIVWPEGVVRT